MTNKAATYWTEKAEKADAARLEQQLHIARDMILAGIEMAAAGAGAGT